MQMSQPQTTEPSETRQKMHEGLVNIRQALAHVSSTLTTLPKLLEMLPKLFESKEAWQQDMKDAVQHAAITDEEKKMTLLQLCTRKLEQQIQSTQTQKRAMEAMVVEVETALNNPNMNDAELDILAAKHTQIITEISKE